jgi:hypothetical protein
MIGVSNAAYGLASFAVVCVLVLAAWLAELIFTVSCWGAADLGGLDFVEGAGAADSVSAGGGFVVP